MDMKTVRLNLNESLVYLTIKRAAQLFSVTRCEYCNADIYDEMCVEGFEPSEVKGYISSLVKKGLIQLTEGGIFDGIVLELHNMSIN